MNKRKKIEKINSIERNINLNIDLLDVAKDFCEFNFDKAAEISALFTMLEIMLKKQKELATEFDMFLSQIKLL